MLKAGVYKCPVCCKALINLSRYYADLEEEIAQVQMPEEYREMQVNIHCNDCNQ
jgi:RING finger/CHY zinc finger protein 1